MTPAEALAAIRGAGLRGIFRMASHAIDRAAERGASRDDVRHALRVAPSCAFQANGRWRADSLDLDGDELTLIIAIDGDVVVVTLF